MKVQIRLANAGDVEGITALCAQLGHPATTLEVQRRLDRVQQEQDHAVFVAERTDGTVIGWIHVFVYNLLVSDPQASLGGLVVDEGHRGQGIGRRLLQWAERWARERGCWAVYVRSNVIRERTHSFYEGLGYDRVKAQLAFRKTLKL